MEDAPALQALGDGTGIENMLVRYTSNNNGPSLITVLSGGYLRDARVERPNLDNNNGTGTGGAVSMGVAGSEPATVSNVTIDNATGGTGVTVGLGGGSAIIEDVDVTGRGGGIVSIDGADVVVRRTTARGISRSIDMVAGELHVSSSVLLTHPAVLGAYAAVGARGTDATLRNVTVDAKGTQAVNADYVSPGDENQPGSTVSVHGSIFRNATFHCEGESPPDLTDPNTIAVDTSNVDNAAPPECGPQGTGNVDVDPEWVNPAIADFRLLGHSSMIDAAGTAAVTDPEANQDFAGDPRLRDGDGDGTPERDMGAVEYQPQPPTAVASVSPGSGPVGAMFAFSAFPGTTDPNPGDTLTFSWTFDDGLLASGPSAQRTFGTPGAHSGTLTVTDQSGQTAQASAGVTVDPPTTTTTATAGGLGGSTAGSGEQVATPVGPAFSGGLAGASRFKLARAISRGVGPFTVNPRRPNWNVQATLLQGRKVVGRLTKSGAQPGRTSLTIKLTRAAKRSLRRKRSVKLTLRVVGSSAVGDPQTLPAKTVTLRR